MIALSKKVCLLGDFAVGKTSLVRRFVYNMFDDKYLSTLGVKVSRKNVVLPLRDQVVDLTLMLWDLAGSEEFNDLRASYLRGAAGGLLVCDMTRPDTLASLREYAAGLRAVHATAPLVIAANKDDLRDQHLVTVDQVREAAHALEAVCFFTSARTGQNVEDAFRHLGRLLAL